MSIDLYFFNIKEKHIVIYIKFKEQFHSINLSNYKHSLSRFQMIRFWWLYIHVTHTVVNLQNPVASLRSKFDLFLHTIIINTEVGFYLTEIKHTRQVVFGLDTAWSFWYRYLLKWNTVFCIISVTDDCVLSKFDIVIWGITGHFLHFSALEKIKKVLKGRRLWVNRYVA